MSIQPPITAVVVTYHSVDTVGKTLTALRAAHERGMLDCIVVDNTSKDGTASLVEKEHPWATLIKSPINLGYGRGCNLGLRQARTPCVLFLNPDAIVEHDALRLLLRFMEDHPKAGIIAPATVSPDGHVQHAGAMQTPWRIIAAAMGYRQRSWRPIEPGSTPFQTNWLCGAILLARRDLMNTLGGFDPRFFLYFDETDLCRRVTAGGAELWAVGGAVATHVGGASTSAERVPLRHGCIAEHYFQSRFYYLIKHHGLVGAAFAEIGELTVLALRELKATVLRRRRVGFMERIRAPLFTLPPMNVGTPRVDRVDSVPGAS